jgi:hypothetical protein
MVTSCNGYVDVVRALLQQDELNVNLQRYH